MDVIRILRNTPAWWVLACYVQFCVIMFVITRWIEHDGLEHVFIRVTIWRLAWVFLGSKVVLLAPVLRALED